MKLLQWTTYDGTPETLPPEGKLVLVNSVSLGEYACAYLVMDEDEGRLLWADDEAGEFRLYGNDSWLPIPTPEQLEAMARVIELAVAEVEGESWETPMMVAVEKLKQVMGE